MKIKEMFADEQPREKMLSKGVRSLTNAELLAVLLRTGTVKMNVLDVARSLLVETEGHLSALYNKSVEGLCAYEGIGVGKALVLMAALELGRRAYEEGSPVKKDAVTGPKEICKLMLPRLKGLDHEECWGLWFNKSNYLINKEMLSRGGMDSTLIDTRYVARRTVEKGACAIVVVHNHPSGNPRPSLGDIRQTEALKNVLAAFDVALLDHVILSDDCYFSFQENEVTML